MTKSIYSLPIHFSIKDEISNEDTRFLKCTIDVLHTGLNFNNSVFTKEVVEENINTIKNTPILGYIREVSDDEYDFAGHEYIITKDENGIRRKNIGSVWGVIPESCNYRWHPKTLDTGEEVEMLQVDALLWSKMEDAIDIMKRDIEKGQSMELCPESIEGYEDLETGIFHFTKFSFDGCTILGREICPAMQDANITIYSKNEVQFSLNDFVRSIQTELNDKYSAYTKIVESADFTQSTEVVNEKTNGGVEIMDKTNFSTVLQQFEDISTSVMKYETITNIWGEEAPRYYAVDIQENEVIVIDTKENYNYYAFAFIMEGDKPNIDFAKCKRKKVSYEDYVDGTSAFEGSFEFGKYISEMKEIAFAKIGEANTKVSEFEAVKNEIEESYNQIKADYEELKPKYEEYVKAEQARIDAELEAQKDAEFAKYERFLAEDAEFEALKKKKLELTLDEIEKECAVLYVRKDLAQMNFSRVNNSDMTAGLVDTKENEGFVETKYGNIPVK